MLSNAILRNMHASLIISISSKVGVNIHIIPGRKGRGQYAWLTRGDNLTSIGRKPGKTHLAFFFYLFFGFSLLRTSLLA